VITKSGFFQTLQTAVERVKKRKSGWTKAKCKADWNRLCIVEFISHYLCLF